MIKPMIAGIALTAAAMSCASSFPYKYYGIWPSRDTLLAADPKNDLPLNLCEPDDSVKGKCVVLFVDQFDRLLADYISMKERLSKCEKNAK